MYILIHIFVARFMKENVDLSFIHQSNKFEILLDNMYYSYIFLGNTNFAIFEKKSSKKSTYEIFFLMQKYKNIYMCVNPQKS